MYSEWSFVWCSFKWSPERTDFIGNTYFITFIIDNLADISWGKSEFLGLSIKIFIFDSICDMFVFPRGTCGQFNSSFKLFLGMHIRIENPLSLVNISVWSHNNGPIVKDAYFLLSEFSIQYVEVFD